MRDTIVSDPLTVRLETYLEIAGKKNKLFFVMSFEDEGTSLATVDRSVDKKTIMASVVRDIFDFSSVRRTREDYLPTD